MMDQIVYFYFPLSFMFFLGYYSGKLRARRQREKMLWKHKAKPHRELPRCQFCGWTELTCTGGGYPEFAPDCREWVPPAHNFTPTQ